MQDREGTVGLHVHANDGTSSVLARPQSSRRYFASQDQVTATVPVAALTLDTLARRAGLARIDLLKLDTQGNELAVLRGAPDLLTRATHIVVEVSFVELYKGRVVDVAADSLIIEASGTEEEIDALVALVGGFGIRELVRTGAVAMARGTAVTEVDGGSRS